jgi:ABC-2 type transport system ATP-binding protein
MTFSVNRGEVFGYIGANGAGKTTTIKILTGLIRPNLGDAFVCGHSVLNEPLEVKARIGYIPESGAVFEKLSPREYLTSVGRMYRLPDAQIQDQIERWLDYFALLGDSDRQRIGTLSKGNKQKVCWAAALMHDPAILILDEPLTGLDVETILRVKDLMKELAARGKTIFYSSHLVDVMEKVCDRVAVIHQGSLIAFGSVDRVRREFGSPSLESALMRLWRPAESRPAELGPAELGPAEARSGGTYGLDAGGNGAR